MKRALDFAVYLLARAVFAVAARIPQAIGYTLADALGRLWFRLDRRRRRRALEFLRTAYPQWSDRQRLAVGAAATGNLFKVPLDMARLTRWLASGRDLGEVVDYAEAELLLRQQPPFLGLTAHLGNWEVAAAAVAQRQRPAHGIARAVKNPWLWRWILANRAAGGLVIHPRRGGLRHLAAALQRGEVGLQVVDQHQRLRGVMAPFFGRLASCERAAASLALRHGYPVVFGVALRQGRGFRFRFVVHGPLDLPRTGDRQADLVAAVTAINRAAETMVRLAPEQYLWLHDRYRTPQVPADGAAGDAGDAGDGEGDGDGAA